jgi:hypothetical protein
MGGENSYVVRYPGATIQSTKVSASSKRLLDQRHDEIALMVLKIENAIQAKQKPNTRECLRPELQRKVILRTGSPLPFNKQLVILAPNKHSFSGDRTSDRRLDSVIGRLPLILDQIQLCDATAHCHQMLTLTHLRAVFFRAREAQTLQLMVRCIGKLCEASTLTPVLGCVVNLPLRQVSTVPEPVDGVECLTKTELSLRVLRPQEQFRVAPDFEVQSGVLFVPTLAMAIAVAALPSDFLEKVINELSGFDALFFKLHCGNVSTGSQDRAERSSTYATPWVEGVVEHLHRASRDGCRGPESCVW